MDQITVELIVVDGKLEEHCMHAAMHALARVTKADKDQSARAG